jgi:hypothetical protein
MASLFISHSSNDLAATGRVVERLTAEGLPRRQRHRVGAFRHSGRNQSGSRVGDGTMGREVFPLLSAPWTCPASGNQWVSPAQHPFLLGCWSAEPQIINID